MRDGLEWGKAYRAKVITIFGFPLVVAYYALSEKLRKRSNSYLPPRHGQEVL